MVKWWKHYLPNPQIETSTKPSILERETCHRHRPHSWATETSHNRQSHLLLPPLLTQKFSNPQIETHNSLRPWGRKGNCRSLHTPPIITLTWWPLMILDKLTLPTPYMMIGLHLDGASLIKFGLQPWMKSDHKPNRTSSMDEIRSDHGWRLILMLFGLWIFYRNKMIIYYFWSSFQ